MQESDQRPQQSRVGNARPGREIVQTPNEQPEQLRGTGLSARRLHSAFDVQSNQSIRVWQRRLDRRPVGKTLWSESLEPNGHEEASGERKEQCIDAIEDASMARNRRATVLDAGLAFEDGFGQIANLAGETNSGAGNQPHPPITE